MLLAWDLSGDYSQVVNQGCSHLMAQLGLQDLLLRWLTPMAEELVLAVGTSLHNTDISVGLIERF